MNLALPYSHPFREMITFYYPNHVELSLHEQTLKACPANAAMLIDVLAEVVTECPGKIWSFEFSRDHWQCLCGALGEMYPDKMADYSSASDRVIDGHAIGFKGPHRKGGLN